MKRLFTLMLLALTMSLTAQENLEPIEYTLSLIDDADGGTFVYGAHYVSDNCMVKTSEGTKKISIHIFYSVTDVGGEEHGWWTFSGGNGLIELNLIQGEILYDEAQDPVIDCHTPSGRQGTLYMEQGAYDKITSLVYMDSLFNITIEDVVRLKKYKPTQGEDFFKLLNSISN